jgi:two-component system chemotaxis response regulator CheY
MKLNVLIVDDSAVMRGVILRTLRLSGFPLGEVHQAANGREGLDVLEEHWVDLALVDVNMPVMNGERFLEELRGNPLTAGLAVVVVSTESSSTRIERIEAHGAAFVHKPFTPEQLRDVIADLTGVDDADGDRDSALASVDGDF